MASPVSVSGTLSFSWNKFKSRPWFFVGTVLIYAAVQFVFALSEQLGSVVAFLVSLIGGTLLAIGLMSLYLKAHDSVQSASFNDLWNPKPFWQYLATSLVVAIVVILGLLALIVPGIILAIAFSMAPYLVLEKRVWPMSALKQSWNLTKGSWLNLFLLGLVLVVINFVGAMLLMIGLLVTIPVSMLAMAHVYRTLSGRQALPEATPAEEIAPPSAPAPNETPVS